MTNRIDYNEKKEIEFLVDVNHVFFDMVMINIEIDVSIKINDIELDINNICIRKTNDHISITLPSSYGPRGDMQAIVFHNNGLVRHIEKKIKQYVEENEFIKSFFTQYYK